MSLSRRSFMGRMAGGVALAGAAATLGRRAFASGGTLDATLSTSATYNVLEVFLSGGADLWTHAFRVNGWDDFVTHVNPGLETLTMTDLSPELTGAVTTWKPTSVTESQPFATMGGDTVRWGPAFKPLWMSGLYWSTRMVCTGNNFPPHEAAVPLALTGTSIGRPIGSALGAAVNRLRSSGEAPLSFVVPVAKSGIPGYILQAAAATGFHGAQHRPPIIGCGDDAILTQILRQNPSAGTTVPRAQGDTLRNFYNAQYRGMLSSPGGRARSRAYDAYEGSLSTLHDHLGVQDRLGAPGLTFTIPGTQDAANNAISTAIRAASKILTQGARHCMVVDTGWDTHHGSVGAAATDYALYNFRKVYRLAHALAWEATYGDLDLSNTLVYVHSEFGRFHENTAGTAHSPDGYPVLLIGGPITGPSIAGEISGPALFGGQAYSDGRFGVAGVRAAVALAAGVNPWHDDMYTQSYDWLGSELQWYPDNGQPLDNGNLTILEDLILGI